MSCCPPTWQQRLPFCTHPLPAHWRRQVTVIWWWRQRQPDRKELCLPFLVLCPKKSRVLPGTTPLGSAPKTLSQAHCCLAIYAPPCTPEIGNICPFGNFDLYNTPCAQFKNTRLYKMGSSPHPHLPQARPGETPKCFMLCSAFKASRKIHRIKAAGGTQAKYTNHQGEFLLNST